MLEPGDKVCFKDDHTRVAAVRDANFHEGVVLLDWPNGAIGSAFIEDLLLFQDNESAPDVDNPNKTFKRL